MESLQGNLLIASPVLFDPDFRRTVVLVGEHGEEGALGIVLNRPSETTVSEAAPELQDLVEPDALVYVGGPVEPGAVVVLAEFEDAGEAAALVLDDVGFLRAGAELDELGAVTRRARVFAGYAGWGPGQLEGELEAEDWILEPPAPDDIFGAGADDLWGDVLRRKGGQFALVARMPLDPSVN